MQASARLPVHAEHDWSPVPYKTTISPVAPFRQAIPNRHRLEVLRERVLGMSTTTINTHNRNVPAAKDRSPSSPGRMVDIQSSRRFSLGPAPSCLRHDRNLPGRTNCRVRHVLGIDVETFFRWVHDEPRFKIFSRRIRGA